jgi:biopolymer transport protein ExbB/TolQ
VLQRDRRERERRPEHEHDLSRRDRRLDRDQGAPESEFSRRCRAGRGGSAAGAVIDRRFYNVDPELGVSPRARPVVPGYTSSLMSWEMMRNLVRDEWLILSLLLAWSLAGLAVICERLYALWNLVPKSEAFKNRVIDALERGDVAKATALCEMSSIPIADVFERGLAVFGKTPEKTTEAVTSQRTRRCCRSSVTCGRWAPVGSSAPFVGLFGTVVGILKAFTSMSVAGTGGLQGGVAGHRCRAGGHRRRPAGRDLRGHCLQLFRRAHRRHRHALPPVRRGISDGAGTGG